MRCILPDTLICIYFLPLNIFFPLSFGGSLMRGEDGKTSLRKKKAIHLLKNYLRKNLNVVIPLRHNSLLIIIIVVFIVLPQISFSI